MAARCSTTAPRLRPSWAAARCPSGSGCASSSISRAARRVPTRVDWRDLDPPAAIDAPRVVVESDLRAAALAEARFGAGAGVSPFLFVIVGTGASVCLVLDGSPYAGAHGEAITLGAPPVEGVASGPALARAAGLGSAGGRALRTLCTRPSSTLRRRRSASCLRSSRTRLTPTWSSSAVGSAPSRRSRDAWSALAGRGSRTPGRRRSPSFRPGSDTTAASSAQPSSRSQAGARLPLVLDETGLWRDVTELPSTVSETLDRADGRSEVAALLGAAGVRRIVASGNGAAYYVAVALVLASLEGRPGPEVVAVPSGLLARGAFGWRPGDALLVISSSGEFRDLVEAVDAGAPEPYAAVTANPASTLGARAGARALVSVANQRAVSPHAGALRCGRRGARRLGGADGRHGARRGAPWPSGGASRARSPARGRGSTTWQRRSPGRRRPSGSGPAWAGALEATLLLKRWPGSRRRASRPERARRRR